MHFSYAPGPGNIPAELIKYGTINRIRGIWNRKSKKQRAPVDHLFSVSQIAFNQEVPTPVTSVLNF